MLNEKGQTLLEMVVVIAVALLVVSALTFATISSLRNSQYAKNQSLATKLAQEGVEKVRVIRDRNGVVNFKYSEGGQERNVESFAKLWELDLSSVHCGNKACFLKLDPTDDSLSRAIDDILNPNAGVSDYEVINNFKRQIQISDLTPTHPVEKTVTAVVVWTDFAGDHESRITTILRNIQQ